MSNRKTLGSYDIQHLTHKPLQVVLCEHDENSILILEFGTIEMIEM